MKRKRNWFGLSFGLSLFALLTAAGCVVVDYQGRKLSFGDDRPPLEVEELPEGRAQLAVRLFGVDTQVDFTQGDKVVDLLLDFLCLPHS